ncbi:MAG TPA: D-alanine--D-alanine ligase family protein [Candidatus Acidoferrum sp.]|nr:D-alanine--D-alanine ligase family protein [Candidatus Acidoferrum sp.]
MTRLRVGVVFGGRSGEHEVSLASAASVMSALERGGHTVVPIGIARDGHWVVGADPLRALAAEARISLPSADPTGAVKKALVALRGEPPAGGETSPSMTEIRAAEPSPPATGLTMDAAPDAALARVDSSSGLPPQIRRDVDVVVVMLHGPYGEDGTIQGLLELADVPYTGAGVLASAVGMDKITMKTLFRAHGLPIVDFVVVERRQWREDPDAVARRVADEIGFPCFVKPSNLGSSVGISKVAIATELPAALDEAARHDRRIVVEHAVKAREVEISVLGNDDPTASEPCEIVYESEWYDYATKYADGQARLLIPAPIPADVARQVRELAIAAFRAIDCAGMARVDFFLEGDRLFVNEINTIPGFTATSGYARMWEASGLDYVTLVDRLIHLAVERHREKSS